MSTEIEKFNKLIKDQFEYGGSKYAATEHKESTDMLFDSFGKNWLLGTMAKYCYRTKNLKRERDILKIATYCYILWLKKGFHVARAGLKSDVLDTTVKVKSEQFDVFVAKWHQFFNEVHTRPKWYENFKKEHGDDAILDTIIGQLDKWAHSDWADIDLYDLLFLYSKCFLYWKHEFAATAGQDTDIPDKTKVSSGPRK
jgi:hypothetical protein